MFRCHTWIVDGSGEILFDIPIGTYTQITFIQVGYNSEDTDKGTMYGLKCSILQNADTICIFKAPSQNTVLNTTYTIDPIKIVNNKIGFSIDCSGIDSLNGHMGILFKYH